MVPVTCEVTEFLTKALWKRNAGNGKLFTFIFKFINLKFSIMNKKFLSVTLFSALMIGATGTFTSCTGL